MSHEQFPLQVARVFWIGLECLIFITVDSRFLIDSCALTVLRVKLQDHVTRIFLQFVLPKVEAGSTFHAGKKWKIQIARGDVECRARAGWFAVDVRALVDIYVSIKNSPANQQLRSWANGELKKNNGWRQAFPHLLSPISALPSPRRIPATPARNDCNAG